MSVKHARTSGSPNLKLCPHSIASSRIGISLRPPHVFGRAVELNSPRNETIPQVKYHEERYCIGFGRRRCCSWRLPS